ncbi:MAG: glutamate--tRNA ligase family protein [Kiritimatiellia bacterium]
MSEHIRVRFAPSPTGKVHIGNIRAAIFNWLYARHTGGEFLLRVEDTDLERSTPEAIQTLLDCMKWLNLTWDGEIMYQTAQRAHHLEVAQELLDKGFAYKDNKGGQGECIIFRMPTEGTIEYDDLVKGHMKKQAKDTQDFVIVRSDGSPVFHLANVLDDITQGVTHIIRGDDHVENTFKHIQLFKAIGAPVPHYAHLPMIVNNAGKPYSKRDGSAFVGEFHELGYLPETLFNYLALLGWAPGDDREIMTREEMVEAFAFEKCKSSAARFDMKKLTWMNGEYIAHQPAADYARALDARLTAAALPTEPLGGARADLLSQMQPRTKTYADLPGNFTCFFTEDYAYDETAVAKRLKPDGVAALLDDLAERFAASPCFEVAPLEAEIKALGEANGSGMGPLVHPIRVAVSGVMEGPGLFEMLVLLGRERTVARLHRTATRLREGTL